MFHTMLMSDIVKKLIDTGSNVTETSDLYCCEPASWRRLWIGLRWSVGEGWTVHILIDWEEQSMY